MEHQVVSKAREWIGTPFHHQGRLKGIGCDCLGMLIGVAQEMNLTSSGILIHDLDNTNYSRTPNVQEMHSKLEKYFQAIEIENILDGDILLMEVDNSPQHLGIVATHSTGCLSVIHALNRIGVSEHILTEAWKKRIYKAYRICQYYR